MSTTTTDTTTTRRTDSSSGPIDPIGADLMKTLRALKLGGLKDTLPERLALARTRKMGHAAFLQAAATRCSPFVAAEPGRV